MILLTINLPDCKVEKLDLTDQKLTFSGSSHQKDYGFELEFFGKLELPACQKAVGQRSIFLHLAKLDKDEGWWPRLTKEKVRLNFVKTDFDRWKDEDESEDEAGPASMMPSGMDFSQFGMGGDLGNMPSLDQDYMDSSSEDEEPATEESTEQESATKETIEEKPAVQETTKEETTKDEP
ncbi:hypothetical protein BB559_004020 [Furculomyces boomerangus]|uniref:CS domain-containing protein n=2 Tax=Harpellales TaxID=61421 RepID=A0A2T9YH90_9FUNG|nr:hypothetical protein BB559_004020 [Furculomyces boomerangus]PVZ98160.1 hypothetical protein BB558_005833 [Smittium angustum]